MSFGSPSPDLAHGQYIAVFTHANGQELTIQSRLTPGPESLDPEDMDEAWSAAIGVLDADVDFTFNGGMKNYTTNVSYTA